MSSLTDDDETRPTYRPARPQVKIGSFVIASLQFDSTTAIAEVVRLPIWNTNLLQKLSNQQEGRQRIEL